MSLTNLSLTLLYVIHSGTGLPIFTKLKTLWLLHTQPRFILNKICVSPTQRVCMFHVILTINSNSFHIQHSPNGLLTEANCIRWGTKWTFTHQTANGVLGDVVHRFNEGVHYFPSTIRFQGPTCLNVILFTPVRELRPSSPSVRENHKCLLALRSDLSYGISPKSENNRYGGIFIYAPKQSMTFTVPIF
jgi:hypothetical protein